MNGKIEALNYCRDILQKEYTKANKKYSDICTQIDEGYYLSEKRFNTLLNKKNATGDILESLEWGIRNLNSAIDQEKYLKRMRG